MPSRIPVYRPPGPGRSRPGVAQLSTDAHEKRKFLQRAAWRRLREWQTQHHPLCQDCLERGLTVPMVEVHHVVSRERAPERALDRDNLRSLCRPCHAQRTARGE